MACICPVKLASVTPRCTMIPGSMALDLPRRSAGVLSLWAPRKGTSCTCIEFMVIGAEVDTSMLADPLVLAVSCLYRLVLEGGKTLVSSRMSYPCLVS